VVLELIGNVSERMEWWLFVVERMDDAAGSSCEDIFTLASSVK